MGGALEPRLASRVIVRDAEGRLLLFRGVDPAQPLARPYWFTAGGGLDEGETFEEAAARELREEAGIEVVSLGAALFEDEVLFPFDGVTYLQRQWFYAVEVPVAGSSIEIDRNGWTDEELASVSEARWWSLEELEATTEPVFPADLATLVRSVTRWGRARPVLP